MSTAAAVPPTEAGRADTPKAKASVEHSTQTSETGSEPAPNMSPAPAPVSSAEHFSAGEAEPVPLSVQIDRERSVRVVVLDAPVESNFTEKDLREWSLNFSRPTVVRNAFTPPDLSDEEFFLPKGTKLHANVGEVGHFQDGNGSYTWEKLWSMMKEGKNVYGSFGTGTSNGGIDFGNDCMNNSVYSRSILRMRDRFLPEGMFKKQVRWTMDRRTGARAAAARRG